MTTKQAIIDRACRLIGEIPPTDGDSSTEDTIVNDLYGEVLSGLLETHPWNFATRRAQLTASATTPDFDFDYAYLLPSDFVRVISVHSNSDATATPVWKEELVDDSGDKRMILAESNELWLRYVANITDPSLMPAAFREAFAYALARDLALPLASSNTMQEMYGDMARRALARARSQDAMGGFPERRPRGSWVTVRGRSLPVVGDTP